MGIFDRFKKEKKLTIAACTSGAVVKMEDIPDPAFSQGILGFACGIEPKYGKIFAPADGIVTQLSETLHAIGLETAEGIEILIHIGVDTIDMQGDGFSAMAEIGDTVKCGQMLITMELDKIRAAGHPTVVVTAVTNSDDFVGVTLTADETAEVGAPLIDVMR